jgi:hypothetical protein
MKLLQLQPFHELQVTLHRRDGISSINCTGKLCISVCLSESKCAASGSGGGLLAWGSLP